MNLVSFTPAFNRSYRWKTRHQSDQVAKIDEWISALANAGRPELLGDPKAGSLKGTYGVPLIRGSRLLYSVDRGTSPLTVVLERCCSHKEVYR